MKQQCFESVLLENFHFPFNPNKLELLCWTVSIVKEQFFSRLNDSFGKDPNAMITVDHNHFGVTIRVDRVISEANFISFTCGVDNKFIIQVEQETASILVVNLSSSICFLLRNDFSAIFL